MGLFEILCAVEALVIWFLAHWVRRLKEREWDWLMPVKINGKPVIEFFTEDDYE